MSASLLLRSFNLDGTISTTAPLSLSCSSVRKIVRRYGALIGIPDLAPHDLRRTHARLAREAGAPLEVIQHSLGHASVTTTERYTRTGLEANAGDWIKL